MRGGVSKTTFRFILGTDYTDFTDKINKKTVKYVPNLCHYNSTFLANIL